MPTFNLFNIIRALDIYSTKYTMRINNQTNFKTILGGLLSLFTLGFLIFCFYFFGLDFYKRQNPITFNELKYNETLPELNSTLLDNQRDFIITMNNNNFKQYIFYYKTIVRDLKEMSFSVINYYMPKCKDEIYEELQVPKDSLIQCLDVKELKMGVVGDLEYSSSLEVMNCNSIPKEDLNKANLTCSKEGAVNQFYHFTLKIPKIYFDYRIYDDPLIEQYYDIIMSVPPESRHFYRVALYMYEVEDDKGWIIKDVEYLSKLGVRDPISNLVNSFPNPTQEISFTVNFQLNLEYFRYTRIYTKIQSLFALVGGFMKIIVLFSESINLLTKIYFIDLFFIKRSFQMNEHGFANENSEERPRVKDNDSVGNNNNANSMNLNNLDHSKISKFDKSEREVLTHKDKKSQSRTEGGLWTYLKANWNIINGNRIKKSLDHKNEVDYKFQTAIEITYKMREVEYTLQKLHEFELVKMMVLNENQISAMSLVEKPLLGKNHESYIQKIMKYYESLIEDDEVKEDAVINYFFDILVDPENQKLSDKDNIILFALREDIRKKIWDKYNAEMKNRQDHSFSNIQQS